MSKKILITALAGVAALGLSAGAFANLNSNSDVYVGIQGGYADTNWSDVGFNSDSGIGGRLFAGYDFNQYIAVESGFFYTPEPDSAKTYAGDLVGKITVPVTDQIGLFAKAGPGYLRTEGDDDSGSTSNVDLVYGFGANYKITPNLVADVSFTRYNGHHSIANLSDIGDYQPNTDFYSVGLAYKFNV